MADLTEKTLLLCRQATIASMKADAAFVRFCARRDKMVDWAEYKRLRAIADKCSEDAWDAVDKEVKHERKNKS